MMTKMLGGSTCHTSGCSKRYLTAYKNAATPFSSELSLCSDHVLWGHVLSNCVVFGLKVKTEAELDFMLGFAYEFYKRILLRDKSLRYFSRSNGSAHNGHRFVISRKAGLSRPS